MVSDLLKLFLNCHKIRLNLYKSALYMQHTVCSGSKINQRKLQEIAGNGYKQKTGDL